MNIKIILTICLIFFVSKVSACEDAKVEYFAWAGLKTVPASMSDPITESDAKQRHESGKAYYSLSTCTSGQVVSLTKYYLGKVFFHTEYLYQTDGSILVVTKNSEGKVTKHHVN